LQLERSEDMAATKQYKDPDYYEKKLSVVMERLGVKQFDYDWTRKTAYLRFFYKDKWYRFDHDDEKANKKAKTSEKIVYGTDVFAQLVLAIEDLSRIVERGIYDLDRWVADLVCLPPVNEDLDCFKQLGFNDIPSEDQLKSRYKALAKKAHPDSPNGDKEKFEEIKGIYNQCMDYLNDHKEGV
jgi:hypothetical protein